MSAVEQQIVNEIANRHGLSVRGDWSTTIPRLLGELGSPARGGANLDRDTVDRVAGGLTISETFFMRHHSQLVFAAEHLAGRLSAGADGVGVLSAGCSSGEEPYSLVLCLMRLLGDYATSRVQILGCDLSPSAIAKARAAEYGNWSFRGVPPWLLDQHFEVTQPGSYRLSSQVRERVQLRNASIGDVVAGYARESLDLVMFRNVGIYLVDDYLSELFVRFRRVLRPDGLLVIAPSDPRPSGTQFQRTPHDSTAIYRPALPGAAPPPSTNPQPERRRRVVPSVQRLLQAAPAETRPPLPPEFPAPSTIREMADRGDLESALELAAQLATRRPMDPETHLLHGQLHMAGARSEDRRCAIESLRKAVFVAPQHAAARFWYASALLADGRQKKALGQLNALSSLLHELPEDQIQVGDEMTVPELREAHNFLLEGLT